MGYSAKLTPANLIAELARLIDQGPTPAKIPPKGYVSSGSINFMQLRRMAEKAIADGQYRDAANFLKIAKQLRPTHRNVARRLKAVQARNRLLRRLLLILSRRKLG